MFYLKSTQWKWIFADQVFRIFTDKVGGDPYEFSEMLHQKFTVDDFSYADDYMYFGVLNYFKDTVIPHKIAVYESAMELYNSEWFKDIMRYNAGVELFLHNIWIHDMSKFSANEAFGYARHNFKNPGKTNLIDGFEKAWHHHKMNNPHHPEYWLNPNRSGVLEPIPMPNIYIFEMIADWMGAGKTYGMPLNEWLPANLHKFLFHTDTAYKLKSILSELGIESEVDGGKLIYKELTAN